MKSKNLLTTTNIIESLSIGTQNFLNTLKIDTGTLLLTLHLSHLNIHTNRTEEPHIKETLVIPLLQKQYTKI
jgi:hypothetical protein